MPGKPDRLRYGADDRPPWRVTLVLGLQHACLALVFLVYPVAAATAIGFSPGQTTAFLTACILAMAIVAFLQPLRPPFGSGSLALYIPSPLMLPAVIQAGLSGGLSLIAGVTLLMGATVIALSRLLRHLRVLFPAEVCGVVILMLGVAIASPALKNATGATFGADGQVHGMEVRHMLVAAGTLLGIIVITVFARGTVKLYALAFGLATGVLLSLALGLFDGAALAHLDSAAWFGWPRLELAMPTMDVSLVPLVIVLAIFNGLDNVGVFIGIQRIVDPDWKKMDAARCASGIQASGVGDVCAGALGGMGGGISSAHMGLVLATGTAARIVATCTAALLLAAAFTPKIVAVLMLLPAPVVGAIMAYTAAQVLVAGMELVQSRMYSERRMLTIGLAVLAGLTPLILPGYFGKMSPLVAPIFESSLAISALVAIGLNLLFRLGIAQKASVMIRRDGRGHETASEFLENMGKVWGARRDVVQRATQASSEVIEIASAIEPNGNIELEARFDEMNLYVTVGYEG
ncbi:MAG TPA: solute carrier family 23 protein, partial [Ramlibacter sp.]|nr:solute carrier family 23 protein [Ramlibacter sp.]